VFEAPGPLGLASKRGHAMRVRPNDIHGAVTGKGGAVFLGVQHWLNGVKPHCAGSDYSGIAMGEHHLSKVVAGDATVKAGLTAKDAARLEP
jgi:hypothetical protein